MNNIISRFKPKGEHKEVPFTIFSGFWLTYIFIRGLVYLFPNLFTNVRGIHIHHFSYGIIILTLVGFYSLVFNPRGRKLFRTAFIFGVGMAMTYDEFGMWLRLTESGVGRTGYDAIALITAGFINLLYLDQHWLKLGQKIRRLHFI